MSATTSRQNVPLETPDDLGKFLSYETLDRKWMSGLVFAAASGAISVLIFLLDCLICVAGRTRQGFLGIRHGFAGRTSLAAR